MSEFDDSEKVVPLYRGVQRDPYDGTYGHVVKAADDYASRSIEDSFLGHYSNTGTFIILQPPIPPEKLIKLPKANSTLGQCVAAMVTNCDGFGWELNYEGEKEQSGNSDVKDEEEKAREFLGQPCDDQSFSDVRKRRRADRETIGWSTIEVGRNAANEIIWFRHIPAHTMRKTKREPEPVEVAVTLRRGKKLIRTTVKKRLRRFVQLVGQERVYFKEYGDMRVIDSKTGNVIKDGVGFENSATEVIWEDKYSVGDSYGMPDYINNLPSVLGSRSAEMVNYNFFEENAIPAMAVLLSGGKLTLETVADMRRMFSQKGAKAQNRVLVIEAKMDDDYASTDSKPTVPTLSIQPLNKDRQNDGLFEKYLKSAQENIRSSFRLPPIFLGLSEDYTHATASSSLETAKSQVFVPEQEEFDRIINEKILVDKDGQPMKYWTFRSNPPKLSDGETQVKAFTEAGKLGGVSVNVAIDMANQWLGQKTPRIDEPWGDWPIALVQAEIAKGNIVVPGFDEGKDSEDTTEDKPVFPKRNRGKATQSSKDKE